MLDDASGGIRPLGAARWWLHGSLKALGEALERAGSNLLIFRGPALATVEQIVQATGASAIYWNRRYGGAEIAIDSTIKKRLMDRGTMAHSSNGRLLHEPWEITNQASKPFQVFTPCLRAVNARSIQPPLPALRRLVGGAWARSTLDRTIPLTDLGLAPLSPRLGRGMKQEWQRGEHAAQAKLPRFHETGLKGYAQIRDQGL